MVVKARRARRRLTDGGGGGAMIEFYMKWELSSAV